MASSPRPCPHCPRTFTQTGHLTRHLRSHTNTRPHICPHPPCPKTYARSDNLRRHILSAHTPHLRSYICTEENCDKKFATKQQLNRHISLHLRPTPFKCDTCEQAFRKKNQLAIHKSQHTGRLPYDCPEEGCERSFLRPSHLRKHQLAHNLGENQFVCALCISEEKQGAEFSKFSQLQRHMKAAHPSTPRECAECGKRFRTVASLKRHEETHVMGVVDRLRFGCEVAGCAARYVNRTGLVTHMKAKHLRVGEYGCGMCTFASSYRSALRKHMENRHGDGKSVESDGNEKDGEDIESEVARNVETGVRPNFKEKRSEFSPDLPTIDLQSLEDHVPPLSKENSPDEPSATGAEQVARKQADQRVSVYGKSLKGKDVTCADTDTAEEQAEFVTNVASGRWQMQCEQGARGRKRKWDSRMERTEEVVEGTEEVVEGTEEVVVGTEEVVEGMDAGLDAGLEDRKYKGGEMRENEAWGGVDGHFERVRFVEKGVDGFAVATW